VWYRRTYYDTGKDKESREWQTIDSLSEKELKAMKKAMDKPIEEAVEEKKAEKKPRAKKSAKAKPIDPVKEPVKEPEVSSNSNIPQKKYRHL
jgi:hypothetical protein